MAKNIGIIRFTGKLGGLSGRETAFGNIIQTPGGFKSERLKNDPIYLKSRQLSTEFGRCSKISALLRQHLLPYLKLLPDPYVYNHIQKCILAIKECDFTSPVGSKTVDNGLATQAGAALLRGFSFNRKRHFYFTGVRSHSIDLEQGRLTMNGTDPMALDIPNGVDALGFQLILLRINFALPALTVAASEYFFLHKTDQPASISLDAGKSDTEGLLAAVLFIGACHNADGAISWKRHENNVLQVVAFDHKIGSIK